MRDGDQKLPRRNAGTALQDRGGQRGMAAQAGGIRPEGADGRPRAAALRGAQA